MAHQRFGIIMAGGSGERFWPLSRHQKPKQLLHLNDPDRSMLAESVARATPLIPADQIYIVTAPHLIGPIQEAKTGVPDQNVIAEPDKRNTAGALLFASAVIQSRYPNLNPASISLAILTADHIIGELDTFQNTVDAALITAETESCLVVCGIEPTHPDTGFGYVQASAENSNTIEGISVAPVRAFHEKPNLEKAQDFLDAGDYYWNSGMFFWTLATFLNELEGTRPEMAQAFHALTGAMTQQDDALVRDTFSGLENISIDYALMEHAKKVQVVRGTFPWVDIGTWSALAEVKGTDEQGNCALGDPVLVDVHDSLVYNVPGPEKMAVGVVGLRDVAVIVTEDAVLVVPKGRVQDVRNVVNSLKDRNSPQT